MWLVLWWTLPFLRACSMLADSELGDRQLPDQCSYTQLKLPHTLKIDCSLTCNNPFSFHLQVKRKINVHLGGKCYYQSGPDWCKSLLPVRPGLVPVRAMEASQPFGGQCPRLPLKMKLALTRTTEP